MHDPQKTLRDWCQLVRVGGHLFFIVPDEDLYEQGVFPSRFNSDHKSTFTISKAQSWSPVSRNVLDLAHSLPNGQIVNVVLQDQGYDRRLLKHDLSYVNRFATLFLRGYYSLRYRIGFTIPAFERLLANYAVVDQTTRTDVVAQIQCIVKKLA